jgi:hypothetical protein
VNFYFVAFGGVIAVAPAAPASGFRSCIALLGAFGDHYR